VIGDTVNVASRVEELTKQTGDTVLVTGETKARLNGAAHGLADRGKHVLRGRTEGVDVYALEL
jgi:class 3 adenylate cyclase